MATKRRGHNEGSIYQRSDGRFVGAVSLGMVDGKRRRKVVYGSTREEVRQQLVKIHNDLRRGLPVQTAGTTVASFLEEWLSSVAPKFAPKTLKNYTMVVHLHLIPALGTHKLEKLTQRHVQAMLDAKSASGLTLARSSTSATSCEPP